MMERRNGSPRKSDEMGGLSSVLGWGLWAVWCGLWAWPVGVAQGQGHDKGHRQAGGVRRPRGPADCPPTELTWAGRSASFLTCTSPRPFRVDLVLSLHHLHILNFVPSPRRRHSFRRRQHLSHCWPNNGSAIHFRETSIIPQRKS